MLMLEYLWSNSEKTGQFLKMCNDDSVVRIFVRLS